MSNVEVSPSGLSDLSESLLSNTENNDSFEENFLNYENTIKESLVILSYLLSDKIGEPKNPKKKYRKIVQNLRSLNVFLRSASKTFSKNEDLIMSLKERNRELSAQNEEYLKLSSTFSKSSLSIEQVEKVVEDRFVQMGRILDTISESIPSKMDIAEQVSVQLCSQLSNHFPTELSDHITKTVKSTDRIQRKLEILKDDIPSVTAEKIKELRLECSDFNATTIQNHIDNSIKDYFNNHFVNQGISNLPADQNIIESSNSVLQHNSQINNPHIPAHISNLKHPVPEVTLESQVPSSTQVSFSNSSSIINSNEFSLYISKRAVGGRRLSGPSILRELRNSNVCIPHDAIINHSIGDFHVELHCKDSISYNSVKEKIQSKRSFIVKQLNVKCEKMLIFNVPTNLEDNYITEAICQGSKPLLEYFKILKKFSPRRGRGTNILIVLPIDKGQELIQLGGLRLGLTFCRVSPYTLIQRCRHCQSLESHSFKNCTYTSYCANCSGKDCLENCNKHPYCINCFLSNKYDGTNFPTNHSPSDSCCFLYRKLYTEKRAKLDIIFGKNKKSSNTGGEDFPPEQPSNNLQNFNFFHPQPPMPPFTHQFPMFGKTYFGPQDFRHSSHFAQRDFHNPF